MIYKVDIFDSFILRTFEIVKDTPKYAWLSPRHTKNKKSENSRFKIKKSEIGIVYFDSKMAAVTAAIRNRQIKIKNAESIMAVSLVEIKELKQILRETENENNA